ncbi:MAG TPA: TlyA family RNA methyltransferase [Candidatus Deferrimicrobiaceae bacterium]|nr:TlyA family RNA methyltransferase [Candidatus Deferrimicrobiaceae bacterium]
MSDPASRRSRSSRGGGGRNRLDAEMVARGLAGTRAKAQGLILAGRVLLAGKVVTKCGAAAGSEQEIEIATAPRPFVSRGGEKLAGALDDLGISVSGTVALDVGASTGGFTDCLLRRGAALVYAVDVGQSLLDDALRRDPRVVVLEQVNFRYATPDLLPQKVSLATVDVSFISLRHILPPLRAFLDPGAEVIALVKPQFEVGKGAVGKGGVVRDEEKRRGAVRAVAKFARRAGFSVVGEAESRVKGPRGNREVFLRLRWA